MGLDPVIQISAHGAQMLSTNRRNPAEETRPPLRATHLWLKAISI